MNTDNKHRPPGALLAAPLVGRIFGPMLGPGGRAHRGGSPSGSPTADSLRLHPLGS